jgi:hypothetical protein
MFGAAALLVLAIALPGVPPQKSSHAKAASRSSAAKTSASKPGAKAGVRAVPVSKHSTTAASARNAKGRAIRGKTKKVRSAPAPSYQLHPDPDRYTQIQQALADRGYYKGTVNGEWNDDSVDAMRRFQADNKIDNDGKIDALSLTGLGLGPRHDGSTAAAVSLSAATPPPPPAPDLPPASATDPPQQ